MPSQQENATCPQCGSAMSYRLGEHECTSCGFTQPAGKQQQEERRGSGPGFRQEQQYGGGSYAPQRQYQSGAPVAPPPPPPGSQFYSQQNLYGSSYETSSTASTGSLDLEKKIYFGLQVASALVMMILAFVGAGVASSAAGSSELADLGVPPGMVSGILVFLVICQLIGLAISWFVLFSDQTWIKWACGGCTAIGLLFMLIGMFAPAASAIEGGGNVFSGIIQLGLSGWFLSILWRDIQRLQNYG